MSVELVIYYGTDSGAPQIYWSLEEGVAGQLSQGQM